MVPFYPSEDGVIRKTFQDQALAYVDAVGYFTSGEHDRATELYNEAARVDEKMADAAAREAEALVTGDRKAYTTAREDGRYWYDEGRDAVTELRALINNAKARAAGHPRAGK